MSSKNIICYRYEITLQLFHYEYYRQIRYPSFLELPWNLDDQSLVSVPQQDIWKWAQYLHMQESTIMVLSPEDNLLSLSDQFAKQSEYMLKYLCDITELLKNTIVLQIGTM